MFGLPTDHERSTNHIHLALFSASRIEPPPRRQTFARQPGAEQSSGFITRESFPRTATFCRDLYWSGTTCRHGGGRFRVCRLCAHGTGLVRGAQTRRVRVYLRSASTESRHGATLRGAAVLAVRPHTAMMFGPSLGGARGPSQGRSRPAEAKATSLRKTG